LFLLFPEKDDYMSRDGFSTPGGVEPIIRFKFHIHMCLVKAGKPGQRAGDLVAHRRQPRTSGNHGHIHVADCEPLRLSKRKGARHERGRIGSSQGFVVRWEKDSKVAEAGCAEDGVGHSVQKGITIAVPLELHALRDLYPTESKWTRPVEQGVDIVAVSDAHAHNRRTPSSTVTAWPPT
jgi:hypothetical protein